MSGSDGMPTSTEPIACDDGVWAVVCETSREVWYYHPDDGWRGPEPIQKGEVPMSRDKTESRLTGTSEQRVEGTAEQRTEGTTEDKIIAEYATDNEVHFSFDGGMAKFTAHVSKGKVPEFDKRGNVRERH